jgi:two-component system, sporulation sensor kinase B
MVKSCYTKAQLSLNLNHLWINNNNMKTIIGVLLFSFGIFLPYLLQPELMRLMYDQVTETSLMIDAFIVVSLNTILPIPQFLGVVLVGDDLGQRYGRPWLRAGIPLILVPLAYAVINGLTPLTYHFGGTDVFLWLLVMAMQYMYHGTFPLVMKSLIFIQTIFGVTWLNQVPFLTPFGFGHGSLSMKVKASALSLGFGHVLSLYAVILFFIFMISAMVLWIFVMVNVQKGTLTKQVQHAHEQVEKSRSDREVLHLVHDLKTPLTAMGGLVSLMQMMTKDLKVQEYCDTISNSIQSMSDMISEILYENRKSTCSLKELIDYVRATRLSGTQEDVLIEIGSSLETNLFINKIRVTRAIVNLIDNALEAVKDREHPMVKLTCDVRDKQLWLGVIDNGYGIVPELAEEVWKVGYSTKHHPGFGLSFVRHVAQGHGGKVQLESKVGVGTAFWMILPTGEETYEHFDH